MFLFSPRQDVQAGATEPCTPSGPSAQLDTAGSAEDKRNKPHKRCPAISHKTAAARRRRVQEPEEFETFGLMLPMWGAMQRGKRVCKRLRVRE